MKTFTRLCVVVTLFACVAVARERVDEVVYWNQALLASGLAANSSPLAMTRNAAIVEAAVFDAVNGIDRHYAPIHVQPNAPSGASKRAAAVQAAYASLLLLYPAQKSTLDQERAVSLAGISSAASAEHSVSIARGIQWGQTVADAIFLWRSTDGFAPPPAPFVGGSAVGQWRPTPPGFLPGAGPQFAYMTPWVINTPSQFRPAGPPALTSARYLADFNETKTMGSLSSVTRTADQTLANLFWNASTATYFWNRLADSLAVERHTTLSQNARTFALLNLAMADAAIACWEAKYHYVFWRPVTAIPLADTDGNPLTVEDPTWEPLLVTPAHPEYPSGHSTVSSAAVTVLAAVFGAGTAFSLDSDVLLNVSRSFANFDVALVEVANARVYAGIHFRSACTDGVTTGTAVANYVLNHAVQRL
jgi:membrane-associated phospholipid phosphatase